MSDSSSASSRVELIQFAQAATREHFVHAGEALKRAVGQPGMSPAQAMSWMGYFQDHAAKGSPKATEILAKFRHEYTVLKLTR